MTGSATRKPRLVGGDKGRNKKQNTSLPGSPALWAGSFTNAVSIPQEAAEALRTAIANCAPVEEIKAIIAKKKRS